MKIYLDANFFIRFVEGRDIELHEFFVAAVGADIEFVTSELTLLETLAGAEKANDSRLAAIYEAFLAPGDALLDVRTIDRSVLRLAAIGRRPPGNKTSDAIHVATALVTGCTIFLSSDHKIRMPEGMRIVALEDAGSIL